MCGLIGAVGNFTESDKKAIKFLLRLDVYRGEDSTGLAIIEEKNKNITVVKKRGVPDDLFFKEKQFKNGVYDGPRAKAFIGHNRYATKGAVNDKNAHPFHHGDVVGAHNGTLKDVGLLEDGEKFEVDSEAIFYNLNKYLDPEDTISNIYGAYALTWYDQGEDKLFIIRNKERPLHFARRKDKDVIFWASEAWMLRIALGKAGVSFDEVEEFDEDTLYSIDLSKCEGFEFRKTNWEAKANVKGHTPKYVAPVVHKYQGWTPKKEESKNNVIPFVVGNSSSNSSRSDADIMMMKMLVDTDIRFKLKGVEQSVNKSKYLVAYPENNKLDFDIRIHGDKHKNWNDWIKMCHTHTFKGRIKRVVVNKYKHGREVYFILDLRSIEEISPPSKAQIAQGADKVEEVNFHGATDSPNNPVQHKALDTASEALATAPKKGVGSSFLDMIEEGDELYVGYQGRYINEMEWVKCTNNGCAGCGANANPNDADLIFIDHDEFLGGECGCAEMHKDMIPAAAYYGL